MSVDWSRPQKTSSQVMDYVWGEVGPSSYLGQLRGEFSDTPKAELWMGAHPKAPSEVSGKGLDQWFLEKPELLGEASLSIDPVRLPYLFKVLSAAKPLSIQLHPNKKEAEQLHKKDPKNYPDDNHKPEIAIALEEHEALLGFESLPNLLEILETNPELMGLLDSGAYENLKAGGGKAEAKKKEALKAVFTSLFEKAQESPEMIKKAAEAMKRRMISKIEKSPKEKWFIKLADEGHEGDVGIFCLFFLNYRVLQPGEGVFLKADVPHAYLKGNIIECMANSDNVVRAGLTPKFVDVATLAEIVEVELKPLKVQMGKENGLGGKVYRVPVKEFEVHYWESQDKNLAVDLSKIMGPRFGVVLQGKITFEKRETYTKGDVFFLSNLCSSSMELAAKTELYLARPGDGSSVGN